jgi:hypothetical protein
MKTILKTVNSGFQLDYNETFNSEKNIQVRRKLVPELRKSLEPNFHPSASQITNWLNSLHKSRRSQNRLKQTGKSADDNKRTRLNNRASQVCNVIQWHFSTLH